jgi:fructosamine-3-kinase
MPLPAAIASNFLELLGARLERSVKLLGAQPLSGGCINQVYKVQTDVGVFCIKYNAAPPPSFFSCEADGLLRLKQGGFPHIPEVILPAQQHFLALEYLQPVAATPLLWRELGVNLAQLHKNNLAPAFGYSINNYIGSVPQNNLPNSENWVVFFVTQRIEPLLRMNEGLWERDVFLRFEKLFSRLENYFPPALPSLLHGDLWSGNAYFAAPGSPFLLDPAVYYGHPEAELAFTHLFGGFPAAFYEAYYSVIPEEPGFSERIALYNLYPLLVHAHLFGRSYAQEVNRVLKYFA